MNDRDRFERNRDRGQEQRRPWERQRYQSENSNFHPADEDRDRGQDRQYSRLGGAGEEEYERYSQGGRDYGREYYGSGRDYGEERSDFGEERSSYGRGQGQERVQYGYGSGQPSQRDWGRQRSSSGMGSPYDYGMRDFEERRYGGDPYSGQRGSSEGSWGNSSQYGQSGYGQGGVGQRGYGQGSSRQGQQGQGRQRGRFAGVGPKGYKRSDERIREDVCDALMMHPEIDASEIEVKVSDGEVTLTGTVQERDDKWLAEQVCEGIPGVHDVNNTVRVKRGGSEQSASTSPASNDPQQRNGRSGFPSSSTSGQGGTSNGPRT